MTIAPSNADVARMLSEIRTLMEFAGEPFYKYTAYERAATTIANASPLSQLIASGELETLPGVGKTIGARIREIVAEGASAYHAELAARYPLTLVELLEVPGLGMKTAQMLFRDLGVASVADLERALGDGRLDAIPRLGPKSRENLRRGLLARRGASMRTPIGRALPLAAEFVAYLEAHAPVANVGYAGSLRRAEPSVGDLDLVCTSSDPAAVIRVFVAHPRARAVLAEGPTKGSIWLEDGFQIDVRVLPEEMYGNLLQHFTGSREHNVRLRELAVRRGLRVSENGIADLANGKTILCRTEVEVYAALGLPFIPPELRLGTDEIELAAAGALPQPVELADLRGDFHMHCTSSDGVDTLETMIAAAKARGYAYHGISDHSWGRGPIGMDPADLRAQRKHVEALGERFGIRTLCASEVDILPDGTMDFPDDVLAELDLVIGSVHSAMQLPPDEMTRRIIRACENPYVNVIGHPTGRRDERPGYDFDHDAVFAAAARTGTALELDGQPKRLDLPASLARRARTFGVTFAIDSDAHGAGQLGNVAYAVGQARRAGIEAREVLNARPIAEVLAFVAAKRPHG